MFSLWFLLALVAGFCHAYTRIDLGALQWTASSRSQDIQVPGRVPGGIYSDLMDGGVLTSGAFYYRSNDEAYRWVAYDNWTYAATFNVDHTVYDNDVIALDCKGIDTVATILINGAEAGKTDNMFIRYMINIKDLVILGSNSIEIQFESPVTYAKRQFDLQLQSYIVPPECTDPAFQGECHANHIRKMQASFSWDWGPAFPSMGVWQPLALEAFNQAVLRYVKWFPVESGDSWICKLDLIFDVDFQDPSISGTVSVMFNGSRYDFVDVVLVPSLDNPLEAFASVTFSVLTDQTELWWPNGYGEQKLYDLEVVFDSGAETDISSVLLKVGFRTVELIQEPLVQGLSFKFRINGVDIFMKGSNWIPAHVLPEAVTRDYIYDLLYSAKEAHMNMLRVWGGGIYELDEFYEVADELGILIWQDHMFACSMYQANPDNLRSADLESQHQVRRLQHHASIAMWAGNNENEKALRDNWYGTNSNFELYKAEYIKLYADTIMARTQLEDPSRAFMVSSPSNGDQSVNEGFIAEDPGSPIYGDVHYYNYLEDNWDYTIYPSTRFGSEYGFQSFPSFEIIETVSDPIDWKLSSDFMTRRQHHPNGNLELQAQIASKMDLPTSGGLETYQGFKEFLYLCQVYQAMSLKTETEHYRRLMTGIDATTGEGQCMGALYWQLNDVWPGASWSSLEFGGKWKMSHYYAKRAFKETIISPIYNENSGNLEVYAITDSLNDLQNISMEVKVRHWSTLTDGYDDVIGFTLPAQTAMLAYEVNMSELMANASCASMNECYIYFSFGLTFDREDRIDNWWMPYPKEAVGMGVPDINVVSVKRATDCESPMYPRCFSVIVQSDMKAPFVWLEALGIQGHFEDNGFLLENEELREAIYFYSKDIIGSDTLERSLQVRSYKNSFMLPPTSKAQCSR